MTVITRHLLVGVASGLLALLVGALPVGELFELKLHDLFLSAALPRRAPENIVIVAIDEPSFSELGLQWPWPRRIHAQLVDTLAAAGASVIGFDIVFAEPSNDEDDREFARAIRASRRVVLASSLESVEDPRSSRTTVTAPLERLAIGASSGLAKVTLDPDFVVRRYFTGDENGPTFPEAVARVHAGKPLMAPKNACVAYAGPAGTVETISYYQARDPANYLPAGFFTKKIVLIGRTIQASPEPGRIAPDSFATPFLFSGRDSLMSGVEIHANMVDGLLNNRFVRQVTGLPVILLAFGLGCLGSFLQWNWRPWRAGLIALGFLGCVSAANFELYKGPGLWFPLLPVFTAAVVPYAVFGGVSYLESEKKRRAIRLAFSHYLSPSILDEVLRRPDELRLGGARAEVTLLFSDLAGFTSLSETIAPEEVSRFLNRYFTEMTAIVFAHKGTVDKFVGDALIAFWGAPISDPDHAFHACCAALAMQARLESLREEMRRDRQPEPRARIGLNTGEVVVGNMGSATLFNYTVLGDAVNLAARLEAANKEFGTRILIAKSVVERAGGRLQVRALGALKAKGRAAEVDVFELTGTTGADAATAGTGTHQSAN